MPLVLKAFVHKTKHWTEYDSDLLMVLEEQSVRYQIHLILFVPNSMVIHKITSEIFQSGSKLWTD